MLSCILNNKIINSFDYKESHLRRESNMGSLKCPECLKKVIYCNGDYKIPYFRHESASECENNTYEPMTEEHVNGIINIYNVLKSNPAISSLEVEKYISNTKQRPDIYFEYNNERYCIEYQCSPIGKEYKYRHELYKQEGIKDIWILGTEKYNFRDDFENNCYYIHVKNKEIKDIEDEIDKGESPLLYYNCETNQIYKMNNEGFKPSISNGKNILKRTVNFTLEKINLDEIFISDLTRKRNKTIEYISNTIRDSQVNLINYISEINKELNSRFTLDKTVFMSRFLVVKIENDNYNREIISDIYGNKVFEYLDELKEFVKIEMVAEAKRNQEVIKKTIKCEENKDNKYKHVEDIISGLDKEFVDGFDLVSLEDNIILKHRDKPIKAWNVKNCSDKNVNKTASKIKSCLKTLDKRLRSIGCDNIESCFNKIENIINDYSLTSYYNGVKAECNVVCNEYTGGCVQVVISLTKDDSNIMIKLNNGYITVFNTYNEIYKIRNQHKTMYDIDTFYCRLVEVIKYSLIGMDNGYLS